MIKHPSKNLFSPPRPRWGYIGHRGLCAFAPENTYASFALAAQKGLTWIEFDLRLTSDHSLVIFHDDDVDRTTNGQGKIEECEVAYLKTLDAGSWFHPKFRGERIPIFSEILPKLLALGLFLNIEIKVDDTSTLTHKEILVDTLIQTLRRAWPVGHPLPLVSSFQWDVLKLLRTELPDVPIGYLSERVDLNEVDLLAQSQNCAYHCPIEAITPELVTLTKALHFPLLSYTCNDPKIAQKLISKGVFGIFTDTA